VDWGDVDCGDVDCGEVDCCDDGVLWFPEGELLWARASPAGSIAATAAAISVL